MQKKGIWIILFIFACMTLSFPAYSKKSSFSSWCKIPGYTCLRVKNRQSWQSLFPDERERSIVMRINRTNGQLYPGIVLQIPMDLTNGDLLEYAPFPHSVDAPGEKVIVIDLKQYAWGAYDANGTLIRWGPATGGKAWCDDIDEACRTQAGTYRIYALGSSDCISSKFPVPDGGAPMPFCMYFNGGQALHGSPGGVLRGNVSHGCVRLFVQDAEWLRYDFVDPPMSDNDFQGTKVVVMPYTSARERAQQQQEQQEQEQEDNENNYY
jgi:hypothetical protein